MSVVHTVTIDSAGRLVVPKALRDELGIVAGRPLRAVVRDGRLELSPEWLDAEIVERDGVSVITPRSELEPMTSDDVRLVMEQLRR